MIPLPAYIDPGSGSLIIQAVDRCDHRHPDLLALADRPGDPHAPALGRPGAAERG